MAAAQGPSPSSPPSRPPLLDPPTLLRMVSSHSRPWHRRAWEHGVLHRRSGMGCYEQRGISTRRCLGKGWASGGAGDVRGECLVMAKKTAHNLLDASRRRGPGVPRHLKCRRGCSVVPQCRRGCSAVPPRRGRPRFPHAGDPQKCSRRKAGRRSCSPRGDVRASQRRRIHRGDI